MILDIETAKQVAKSLLQIKANILNTEDPYVWASGWNSPIYCDNRLALSFPEVRSYLAKSIADQIISNHDSYNQWNLAQEFDSQVQDSIAIQAIRNKDVKGTHTISFQNNIDEITITHNAKTREGFAHGALLAAEFIKDKKGVFSMQDVLAIQ